MKYFLTFFCCAVMVGVLGGYTYTEIVFIKDSINSLKVNSKLAASQSISSLTELTSLSHNDIFPITDTANSQTKKVKWGTATSTIKTLLDAAYNLTYSPIFSTSAGLAGILSDETGTGKAVFASSSVIGVSRFLDPTFNITGTEAKGNILYLSDTSGTLAQLPVPTGTGYFLSGSSSMDRPMWDNSVVSFPYNASSTFNATTTIAADSLTNRALILAGLAYKFPTVRTFAGALLRDTDGAGTLGWGGSPQYSASLGSISANNANSTTTKSLVVPAGVMQASSTVTFYGSVTSTQGTNNTGTFYIRDTAGKTFVTINVPDTAAAGGETINFSGTIFNNSSLSSQVSYYVANGKNDSTNVAYTDNGTGAGTFDTSGTLTLVGVISSPAAVNFTINNLVINVNP